MLESQEYKRAEKILDKKAPSYRKAYSDRIAWLMAYMAELAYLKFDKPNAGATVTVQLVERALKGARRGTTEKILGAIRKSYDYDHEEKRRMLESSLKQIGWQLVDTISVNATQAYVACNEEFAVLAFRGTEADRMRDIRADAKATQTTCPTGGRVHSGFKEQYDDVAGQVEMVLNRQETKGKPLFITGHSLGGAVAAIATRRLNAEYQIASCYTYGSPRVGTGRVGGSGKDAFLPDSELGRSRTDGPAWRNSDFFVRKGLSSCRTVYPRGGTIAGIAGELAGENHVWIRARWEHAIFDELQGR